MKITVHKPSKRTIAVYTTFKIKRDVASIKAIEVARSMGVSPIKLFSVHTNPLVVSVLSCSIVT